MIASRQPSYLYGESPAIGDFLRDRHSSGGWLGGGSEWAKVRVEFLYFEECPSHEEALRRLRKVLHEEGIHDPPHIIRVETDEDARRLRFPGSPTIRFDGVDIQPEQAERMAPSLTCRTYWVNGRPTPLPTEEMIRQALRRSLG